MSESIKPFLWAQGEKANVKEPIESLQEHGWRYGDVPAASNVNWLFNRIQKELEGLNNELSALKTSIVSEFELVRKDAADIKAIANRALRKTNVNRLNVDFAVSVSRKIYQQLREMETEIKKFHPTFPTHPWRLSDDPGVAQPEDKGNDSND